METGQKTLSRNKAGELEIIGFKIGEDFFGISIENVREIIPFSKVTYVPKAHPCIKGIFKPRETVITVVDLPKYLNISCEENEQQGLLIVACFNNISVAFQIHKVVGIYKFAWEDVEMPDTTVYNGADGVVTGVVESDEMIIILDFEKILMDINPGIRI